MNNYQNHTGAIIKKRRDLLGRYICTIDSGTEKVSVIVGKAFFGFYKMGQTLIIGHCGKNLINVRPFVQSKKAILWNQFIDEIVTRDLGDMNPIQKHAAIAFCYDAEMNSGGHSGFFDCRPSNVENEDVKKALHEVGAEVFISNFIEAYTCGINDDYIKTDNVFGDIKPPLADIVMDYVLKHKEEIFEV